jgi:hypothetical protein
MPFFPPRGFSQALVVALRIFPVILVVVLSTPAWLSWPFLSDRRQQRVLQMTKELAAWAIHEPTDVAPPTPYTEVARGRKDQGPGAC